MASIRAENLVKRYGNVRAVHGIDFDIADGEFVAILGPSGCGKSSTMRMIAGLETISEGSIYFDGKRINDVRARDRNVAMSFESYALYPTITIYENIAFPLRSAGMENGEIDRRVRDIAEKMELVPLLGLKPHGLSSGQAQRVGWPARWCASRRCSCSTSRSRTSIRASAIACAASSRACTRNSAIR